MKNQLKEKLVDLEREAEEFKKLPNFHSSFDYDAARTAINEVGDEAQYDALQSKMNREFERMHDKLPGYFEQLANSFASIQSNANEVKRGLTESREVAAIKNPLKASSKWCADLNTYVLGSLRDLVKQVETECSSIILGVNKSSAEYAASKPGRPLEKVNLLLEGLGRESELKQKVDSTKAKASTTLSALHDFDKWIQLLSKSDEVHTGLIELKREQAHEAKASELISKLETIWQNISAHLKNRSVTGLGNHKQFYELLENLNEERRKYITGLRSVFEETKRGVNDLLQGLDLGSDYRCKEAFNPDDIQSCYTRLYEEAAKQINLATSIEKTQLDLQRQELLYARDILSRLSESETTALMTQLEDCTKSVDDILAKSNSEWVIELVKGSVKEQASVKDTLQKSREVIRSARQVIVKNREL
jgi:hypothetical protein